METDARHLAALPKEKEWSDWGPEVIIPQVWIDTFSDITNDHNSIHQVGGKSPFGVPIAHGLLVLALLPRLQPDPTKFQIVPERAVINRRITSRFLYAVCVETPICMRTRLASIVTRSRSSIAVVEFEIAFSENKKKAMTGEIELLFV